MAAGAAELLQLLLLLPKPLARARTWKGRAAVRNDCSAYRGLGSLGFEWYLEEFEYLFRPQWEDEPRLVFFLYLGGYRHCFGVVGIGRKTIRMTTLFGDADAPWHCL